jgi:hypothetical protein
MQLSKFFPYLMPQAQGLTEPFAEMMLRQAADEFCRKSRFLREFMDIRVTPGQADYALSPDTSGAEVHDLIADLAGHRLQALPPDLQRSPARHPGHPLFYTQFLQDGTPTLRLIGPPKHPDVLALTLILRPSAKTAQLPDVLFDEWRETLVSGALARLCATPNQPFSSPDLAGYHRALFADGITQAVARATLGNGKAPLHVRPASFTY